MIKILFFASSDNYIDQKEYNMGLKKVMKVLFVMACVLTFVNLTVNAGTPVINFTKKENIKDVKASVTINAPVNTVWKVLTDYNHFTSFMPGIKGFSILQNQGSNKIASIKLDVSALAKPFNYRASIIENTQAKTITMKRTSGDFNYLVLSYTLKPVDNGNKTLLSYSLQIDHGAGIPGSFADRALKNNALKTLQVVESRAVKNYTERFVAQN